ncbi:P-loop containing nucleoside triphosphate hydrolase protein [Dendrothele bispora CBS 962.96]|uniref:ATP-dependent RNA helicase n=1 Tax=Dendrothele bispora (strain CBS 962.96) TaxID=1314807 RepID=A0A4S8MX62_DENBC|nr:P-loop containing nucleoside triphosphate hydrolase protein [Dendrothele bispora CBS 962.96]
MSRSTDTDTRREEISSTSSPFVDLGVRPPLAKALHVAFPNVKGPTRIQADLIPAVLTGKDVILQDDTGVGKSFGLMLALLNKTRLHFKNAETGQLNLKPSVTSLLLVPHRDLAFQFLHWIQRIVNASSDRPPPLEDVVQVLVRDGKKHLTEGLPLLRETPPHILIGTPASVLDLCREDPHALRLEELSSVVLDDVDFMVETASLEGHTPAKRKARKNIELHPGPARSILTNIYGERRQWSAPGNPDEDAFHTPQLVACSATLRRHLKYYFFNETGLFNKDTVKVRGSVMGFAPANIKEMEDVALRQRISHHVVVASPEGIKNASAAVERVETKEDDPEPRAEEREQGNAAEELMTPLDDAQMERERKFSMLPSPFNQDALEAVAMAFALDVPSVALLTIPSDSSVHRAVYDLRALGVNAHGMNLSGEDQGKSHLLHGGAGNYKATPTLLIATPATVRGIDLPELSHVFILGVRPLQERATASLDTYIHVAGRVGRFMRSGKVVSVVTDEQEAEWVGTMLKRLGVEATRLGYFK